MCSARMHKEMSRERPVSHPAVLSHSHQSAEHCHAPHLMRHAGHRRKLQLQDTASDPIICLCSLPRSHARLRHVELRGCMSLTPGGLAAALGPHAGTLEHLLVDDCFRPAPASADAQTPSDLAARQARTGGAARRSSPQPEQGGCSGWKAHHAELPVHSVVRETQSAVSPADPMLHGNNGALGRQPAPVPDGCPGRLPVPAPSGATGSACKPGGALAPLEALVLRCQMLRSLR